MLEYTPEAVLTALRHANLLGMGLLASWALGNMLGFGWLLTRWQDVRFYFAQMNVFWNLVNLALAAGGIWGALKPIGQPTWPAVIGEHSQLVNILLFNGGLDVGYIFCGLYLVELARRKQRYALLTGYGWALVVQGGFLLLFDCILAAYHLTAFPALKGLPPFLG